MAITLRPIVLAETTGRRVAPVTGGVPKQFWSLEGGRCLLEETLDRLAPLAEPDRTVVVVDRTHRAYVESALDLHTRARVAFQPGNRGTAAAILLGLLRVAEQGLDSLVLIAPADQAVADPERFREGVLEAAAHVEAHPDRAIVFGVEPGVIHSDRMWITTGSAPDWSIRPVTGFVDNPPARAAVRLLESGALWNTTTVLASVRTLLDMYYRRLPQFAMLFAETVSLPRRQRAAFLEQRHRLLGVFDFFADVVMSTQRLSAYALPLSVGWSDLGTPERLVRWLAREDSRPAAAQPHAAVA